MGPSSAEKCTELIHIIPAVQLFMPTEQRIPDDGTAVPGVDSRAGRAAGTLEGPHRRLAYKEFINV